MNVIETSGLCKQFGSHFAVDHVAMAVPEGCVYGFIGPNGAGKWGSIRWECASVWALPWRCWAAPGC